MDVRREQRCAGSCMCYVECDFSGPLINVSFMLVYSSVCVYVLSPVCMCVCVCVCRLGLC